MTTYVYETIPESADETPTYFEFKQSKEGAALTQHPETGKLIRRVVLGGYGLLSKTEPSAGNVCGPSCCCE